MSTLKQKYLDFTSKGAILTSILALALMSWAAFWLYTHILTDTTEQAVSAQLQQHLLSRFDYSLQAMDKRAEAIEHQAASLAEFTSRNTQPESLNRLHDAFAQALEWSPDLAGAAVYSGWPIRHVRLALHAEGNTIKPLNGTITSPDWLQQLPDTFSHALKSGQLWWSPIHRHPVSQAPIITLVQPVHSAKGQLQGLISLDWEVDAILQLSASAEVTPGTVTWLTDRLNRHQHRRYADERSQTVGDWIRTAQQQTPQPIFVTGFEQQSLNLNDTDIQLSYAPSRSGLMLTVATPQSDLDAPLQALKSSHRTYLYALGAVIFLLTLFGLLRLLPALSNMRLSDQDKLTGLPNRLRLLQDLERESTISLILVNLDRFREVNSLFGDQCGDLILKEVALRLASFMSSEENRGGTLYRVSADEFALALPRRRPELVHEQMEQILRCVRQTPIHWQNHEIGLSATVGAAVPWIDTPREHSLYIHAREALREARNKGLHCRVYDGSEPLEKEFEHNQKWAGKLRDALNDEGLIAWFQPILNNTTGRIDKYECLVRMLDNNGDVVSPGKFLGVAGKLRLEGHITRVMVEKCFTRFADSPLQFSINLSYSDLQQEELSRFIIQRLDETGVGPRVIFELLESAHIDNYEQVRRFVDEVKKRGCRIAIDDFGTGYSNFEHLLQLKVDFIKIDGSLIRNLDRDPNARRVARGIVGLARSMKIETVAEYVHSEAIQMEVLRLGISFSQGELIGMPAPELLVRIPSELTKMSYSGRNQAKNAVRV